MGKTVRKVLNNAVGATVDVVTGGLSTDRSKRNFKDVLQTVGMATPDALKRQQERSELDARNSAAAAALAASNLEKNQLVDLTDASNSPDVIAGGTANQLGFGGDMRKKRAPGLATQLGVRI